MPKAPAQLRGEQPHGYSLGLIHVDRHPHGTGAGSLRLVRSHLVDRTVVLDTPGGAADRMLQNDCVLARRRRDAVC
jgi:hypothetical protein